MIQFPIVGKCYVFGPYQMQFYRLVLNVHFATVTVKRKCNGASKRDEKQANKH